MRPCLRLLEWARIQVSCLIHRSTVSTGSQNVCSHWPPSLLSPTLPHPCPRWLDYCKALALEGLARDQCLPAAGQGIDGGMLCADAVYPWQAPALSFLYYLVSKGLLLVVTGPATAVVMSVVCTKYGGSHAADATAPRTGLSAAHPDGNEGADAEERWPLESLGVHILPGMRPRFALLEAWFRQRLSLFNSTLAVALVCGPAAGFFILRAFLAKFHRSVGEPGGSEC